jgi:hypothetical protein
MRSYGRLHFSFWTGETGQALQKLGSEAVIMAAYLVTNPHSNMLGLYRLPIGYAAEETGLGYEGASKGLIHCQSVGLCKYDEASKFVWVITMATWEIAKELKESDNRVRGIERDYKSLPDNPFLAEWFDFYAPLFHLKERRLPKGLQRPSEAITGQVQVTGQVQGRADAFTSPSGDVGDFALDPAPKVNGNHRSKPVPFEQIVDLYHERLPQLPKVEKLTEKRKGQIRQRWQDDLPDMDSWGNFFGYIAQSDFLMGRKPGSNGRPPFRADIEWLTNATNFTAIAEGKYHR